MKKPFKKLLGNRVYLNMPEIPESILILSEDVRKGIMQEEQKKWQKLTVYAVGDIVTTVVEGDVVYVAPATLANAPVLSLTDKLQVVMISLYDIAHIWE